MYKNHVLLQDGGPVSESWVMQSGKKKREGGARLFT